MQHLAPVTIHVPNGIATLDLQVFEEEGRLVCGISKLEGHLMAPPKAWLRMMRDGMANIETLAKDAGCDEIRLCGRDWSRIFPDFEPFDRLENGLRKVL